LNRLIAQVEKDMEKKMAQQHRVLTDLNSSANDHAQLTQLGTTLAHLQGEIAQLENQWLELTTELDSHT
jgi:uncharacterized coiled-coil protein SlyX